MLSPGIRRAIVLSGAIGLAAMTLRTHRRKTQKSSDVGVTGDTETSARKSQKDMSRKWRLILNLLDISRDKHSLKIIAAMFGCAFVFAVVDVRKAFVSGRLFRAVFEGDRGSFKKLLGYNIGLCLLLTVFNKVLANLVSSLGRQWHFKLVNKIHDLYFSGNNYYQILNTIRLPHERIATDTPQLTRDMALVACDLVNSFINFAVFSRQIYAFGKRIAGNSSWSGAKLVLGPVGYAVVGSVIVSRFTPNLGFIKKTQRELESRYKQSHVRLSRNAESVALYDGEKYEEENIDKHFSNLTSFNEKMRWSGLPSELVKEYVTKYCLHTAMMLLVLSPFFNPNDPSKGSGPGQAMYRIRVLSELIIMELIALSQIARLGSTIQRVSGLVDRVGELVTGLQELDCKAQAPDFRGTTTDNSIVFDNVAISTPSGHKLVSGLTFTIKPGENFLLCGPNGAGKSSIFRCLGGLWPIDEGKISRPAGDASGLHKLAFYLPQKPYTVYGTLVQNITYPNMDAVIDDVQLSALFRLVELDYLYVQTKSRGLMGTVVNWESRLSLGEQQRLAMARLFWHRPTYAVLDECTSAVSLKMEQRLFRLCRELGITLITISHRPALQDFHDRMLVLDGAGGYQIHKLPQKSDPALVHSVSSRSLHDLHAMLDTYPFDKIVSRLERSGSLASLHPQGLLDPSQQPPFKSPCHLLNSSADKRLDSIRLWKLSTSLLLNCWNRRDVWRVAIIFAIVFIRTYISNSLAGISGDSIKYLLKGRHAQFVQVVATALLMGFLQALFMPMLDLMEGDLAEAWRKRITRVLLEKYLRDHKYYSISLMAGACDAKGLSGGEGEHVVLPDQTIVEDVDNLTRSIANLWSECAKPTVDLVWFASSVYSLTGWQGLGSLAVYMVGGTGFLSFVRPDLGALASRKEQLDGEFAQAHSRLTQCSESISFLEGGKAERRIVDKYFNAKINHQMHQKRVEHVYGVADQFVTYFLPQSASWILSMMYKSSNIGDANGESVVRDLRYLGSVVNQCFSALGVLVQLNSVWATTRGHLDRVTTLMHYLELSDSEMGIVPVGAITDSSEGATHGIIEAISADIAPPSGEVMLVSKLSLTLDSASEKGLMITGPSGSGKSTVLKVLGGRVRPVAGVVRTIASDIHYVPTRPYLTEGCIADQVTYPHRATYGGDYENVMSVLNLVRVAYLDKRGTGIFGTNSDSWDTKLSLGEQQRIAIARLLYQHRYKGMKFAFLDECTSAVALDGEEEMYKEIISGGMCVVTASQKPWLLQFHDKIVQLSEGSTWEVSYIQATEATLEQAQHRLPSIVYEDARQSSEKMDSANLDGAGIDLTVAHELGSQSMEGVTDKTAPTNAKRKPKSRSSR